MTYKVQKNMSSFLAHGKQAILEVSSKFQVLLSTTSFWALPTFQQLMEPASFLINGVSPILVENTESSWQLLLLLKLTMTVRFREWRALSFTWRLGNVQPKILTLIWQQISVKMAVEFTFSPTPQFFNVMIVNGRAQNVSMPLFVQAVTP